MTLPVAGIADALRTLGLGPGDVVYAHCDLKRLGLSRDAGGRIGLAVPPEAMYGALVEVTGAAGTVAVPAYCYSWSGGQVYDPAVAPATTGAFCEFVRTRPGVRRSPHPMLSVAAVGGRAAEVVDGVADFAYGPNTPYDRLIGLNAWVLMVGAPFTSFRDQAEALHRVAYRYPKMFEGEVVRDGRTVTARFGHFVRYRVDGRDVRMNEDFIDGLVPAERQRLRRVTVGTGEILALRLDELMPMLHGILDAEPYRYLREDFCPQAALELIRDAAQDARYGIEALAWRAPEGEVWVWTIARPDALAGALGRPGAGRLALAVGGAAPGADLVRAAAMAAIGAGEGRPEDLLRRLAALPGARVAALPAGAPARPAPWEF